MTITRYITADGVGVLSLVARAVDPNGNPITQKFTITANPLPESQKCYNAVLALGTVQGDIESACAQFGTFNTYYLGNPRSTVYKTDSCSEIIGNGFYKTEDGNWVNISNGRIEQRGLCNTVSVRAIPEAPPLPISLPGGQTMEVFIPKPTFTEPAPSLVPPQRDIVPQGGSSQRVKPTVVAGRTVKEVPSRNPAELIKQAQSLGITVRSDEASTVLQGARGLLKTTLEIAKLRRKVEVELERREKASRATTTTQTFNQSQQETGGVQVADNRFDISTIPDTEQI
jgi:hypothetical protein